MENLLIKVKNKMNNSRIGVEIYESIRTVFLSIRYFKIRINKPALNFDFKVMSIEDTLDLIASSHKSVVRFGDGELKCMSGDSLSFQRSEIELQNQLKNAIKDPSPRILVCLPESFNSSKSLRLNARLFWETVKIKYSPQIKSLVNSNDQYGNAFISRPYMIYKDKSKATVRFKKLKSLWDGKSVLIVEGRLSRTGVGNDLLDNAKSISRILCPERDAYQKYNEILKSVSTAISDNEYDLILVALGPTAKPLIIDLTNDYGAWAIDIGHIDSEYEWYLNGDRNKYKLQNKHTAEMMDSEINESNDPKYLKSIIKEV